MLQRGRIDRHVNAVQLLRFPFRFDIPGLNDGVEVYTPRVGDLLLNAWFEVDEAWDGTTPKGDFGTFVGSTAGLMIAGGLGLADLTLVDDEAGGAGVLLGSQSQQSSMYLAGPRSAPSKFTAANPLKVVVSQDGTAGGADPGATQGKATLYLVLAPA